MLGDLGMVPYENLEILDGCELIGFEDDGLSCRVWDQILNSDGANLWVRTCDEANKLKRFESDDQLGWSSLNISLPLSPSSLSHLSQF